MTTSTTTNSGASIKRFGWYRMVEHQVNAITFITLVATGLAQKFFTAGWASWLVLELGGIEFILPIARWVGYGGETDFHGSVLETITWATGLLANTKNITIFAGAGASKAVDPDQYPTTIEFFQNLPSTITDDNLFKSIVGFLKSDENLVVLVEGGSMHLLLY